MYPYTYPEFNIMYRTSMQETVDFIKDSIQNEYNDIKLYEGIYSLMKTDEEKEIIQSIIKDENSHIHTLKNLYKEITGTNFFPKEMLVDVPDMYKSALKKGTLAEAEAVDACNKLYESIEELRYKNVIQKIINDDLKHLGLFNFMLISA